MAMKITGKRATLAVRCALDEAGLKRTSPYAGAGVTGWIDQDQYGSTGFSVKPNKPMGGPAKPGELIWHIEISGKPHLRYRRWTDYNSGSDPINLHDPVNPEVLFPAIKRAFESLGIEVRSVRYAGAQQHADDDVGYDIVTIHPEWLEAYDPRNTTPASGDAHLVALEFNDPVGFNRSPIAPRTKPLAGYVKNGVPYLTRESIEHVIGVFASHHAEEQELRRQGVRLPPSMYGEATLSEDGVFRLVPKNRADHGAKPVRITNHWGDVIEAWPMPQAWMGKLDAFTPCVPFVLDGEMRDGVPFPVYDAQFGGEAPWLEQEQGAVLTP